MDERYRYITKIARNLELSKRKRGPGGFSSTEEMAIHLIRHNEGISQERLAHMLGVDKALVTRIVRRLVDEGFVERRESTSDGRAYELYPTAKAQELKGEMVSFEDCYYGEILSVLDDGEREQFLKLLSKVYVKSKSMRKEGR